MKKLSLKIPFFILTTSGLVALFIALNMGLFGTPAIHLEPSELKVTESLMLTGMETVDWMTEQQAEKVIEHALGYESAVIFCHADWNMTSQITRRRFARLAAKYHNAYPEQKIGFHYLNLTQVNSKPLQIIPGAEGRHMHAFSHLIWLRDGRLVKAELLDLSLIHISEPTRPY